MSNNFDVIVIGLGAMGSAALYQLSQREVKVLGIDQFRPPHDLGSSHGDTRITRLAIGEGSHYTPMAIRSHEIWKEMEDELNITGLYNRTGLIAISSDARGASLHVEDFFESTVCAAKKHGIAHELLNAEQVRERFPLLNIQDDELAYYEEDGGYLRPEKCIESNLKIAKSRGAQLSLENKVLSVNTNSGITVKTKKGNFSADKLVTTTGAWINDFIKGNRNVFKVYRQFLNWFDVSNSFDHYNHETFPVYIWEPQNIKYGLYGFPAIDGPDGGIKIAAEFYDHVVEDLESIDREVSVQECEFVFDTCIKPLFRGIKSKCLRSAVCMYTTTPDASFVIDKHPENDNIWFASACSGHGFKHSACVGELLAQAVSGEQTYVDLEPFSLSRY